MSLVEALVPEYLWVFNIVFVVVFNGGAHLLKWLIVLTILYFHLFI